MFFIGFSFRRDDVLNTNCDEIYDSERLIRSEAEMKLNKVKQQSFECYLCRSTFGRILQLKQHFTNYHHTDDKLWKCSDCESRFAQRKNLMKHVYKHISMDCEYCAKKFTTVRNLQKHCQRSHKDQLTIHQCGQCPRKFILNAQLRIHMHNHNASLQHNCNICNETFASGMLLKGHIRAVHTTYLCSECGKTFKNKYLLSSHQKVHNSEKPFVCGKCPSRFKWKVALTYHMTVHQQDRKHICETCGMSFTTRSSMKGHMSKSVDINFLLLFKLPLKFPYYEGCCTDLFGVQNYLAMRVVLPTHSVKHFLAVGIVLANIMAQRFS